MLHTPPNRYPGPDAAYLAPTLYFDFEADALRKFASDTVRGVTAARDKAIKLFYAVRDGWRYDPFSIRLAPEHYVASRILAGEGLYCIPKAIVLVAAARAVGVPAAIGLSDVVNHLTTEKLRERMGGKTTFIHHGYAVLYLDGRWVKAAPAFNIELCSRFGVRPTEFDGQADAIFQPYDSHNRRHMEYVRDHGMWSDFPYEKVERDFRAFYPPSTFGEGAAEEPRQRFEDGTRIN